MIILTLCIININRSSSIRFCNLYLQTCFDNVNSYDFKGSDCYKFYMVILRVLPHFKIIAKDKRPAKCMEWFVCVTIHNEEMS